MHVHGMKKDIVFVCVEMEAQAFLFFCLCSRDGKFNETFFQLYPRRFFKYSKSCPRQLVLATDFVNLDFFLSLNLIKQKNFKNNKKFQLAQEKRVNSFFFF